MLEETPVGFGILQRYIIGEVVRAFILALLTIISIFVLFMVMAEAARKGLTPHDLIRLVPFVIPVSLPYTVPVSLLFAVTVVYGRLGADNEVIAVKTAGLNVLTVLKPSFTVGLVLSGVLWYLGEEGIPRANHYAQKIIFSGIEDYFYKVLKKEREFNNANWPFYIRVKDVDGKVLLGALFKHRAAGPDNPNTFDITVFAEKAIVNFDLDHNMAHVYLEGSEVQGRGAHPDLVLIDGQPLDFALPDASRFSLQMKIQEMTVAQMKTEQAVLLAKIANERKRQAIAAAMWIGSGRIERVDWLHLDAAFRDYKHWERKYDELDTEQSMRYALALSSICFVLVGAPVGIRFPKRDFLSAFIVCFLPIIAIYYPLTLLGVNLGKEGIWTPWFGEWASLAALSMGNVAAVTSAVFLLPGILKH
jgi:lipopolysaccharide export system permease protein